jgi:TolB-like protein/tetratricopeptide (TPR) repeat protein
MNAHRYRESADSDLSGEESAGGVLHVNRNIAATIALAPFENLSGDPTQDVLALGFVEDVASALSRFGAIEVMYPQAFAAASLGRSGSGRTAVASNLLRGSVRRAGDVIRIAVQLIDTHTGRQIWADRHDVTAGTLFTVQDQIAEQIASALKISVDRSRLRAAQRAPLSSLVSYDCWLRGFECLKRGTIEADAEARIYFDRALETDPSYARAHAGLSLSHFNEWSCQAWQKWDQTERLAYEYARRAAALDDDDPMVQVVLGRILLYRRRFDEAAFHVDRSLTLNPNDTDVLVHAALCRAYLGDADSALALGTKAMRLHPGYPPYYGAPVGLALFVLGRDAEVLALGAQAPLSMFVDIPAFLAASCALTGDLARARIYLAEFLSQLGDRITYGRPPDPGEPLRWLLHVNPFRRPEDSDRLEQGLRLAGLEEDPDERRPQAVARPVSQEPDVARFRREGVLWRLEFDGFSVQLTHQKGFTDLARLLERPGVEVHCLELADRPAETTGTAPQLDDRARREIQARARELQHDIDEADAAHDLARAEQAREELDQIVELLSGALGLGGRSRALGSAAERARSAVTWRIRSAVKKIAKAHPQLGRHLENAMRTGTFCVYQPERPVDWHF